LKRLEEIVKQLEEEELPLEKSLSLFEEGAELVRSARRKLSMTEARVRKIVKALEESPELEDFRIEE